MNRPVDARDASATFHRGPSTWLLYAAMAMVGFSLNGLGAVLAPLQSELSLSRPEVSVYTSMFAVALVLVGLVGGRLAARVDRRTLVVAAVALMSAGSLLLAVPQRVPSLAGALALGLGAALAIQVVPTSLNRLHPDRTTVAIGEANALASTASVLAPLAAAAAIATVGWRVGYLAPIALAGVAVALTVRRVLPRPAGDPAAPPAPGAGRPAGRTVLGRWVDVVLSVAVEFSFVFWAAQALTEWHALDAGTAAAWSSLFLVGMAVGRASSALVARFLSELATCLTAIGVATVGFGVYWASVAAGGAAVGLLIAGLGVSLLYPITLGRLIEAHPGRRDVAGSRGALASGVAIGSAPTVLALVAGAVDLRTAYLVVPALLALLVVRLLAGNRRTRVGRVGRPELR